MSGYLSVIICVVGAILFIMIKNPAHIDFKMLAKDMFWTGLLAFLIQEGSKAVSILK